MKQVKMKEISQETQERIRALEDRGIFPTKLIELLKNGRMNGMIIEVNEVQYRALQELLLIENDISIENTNQEEIPFQVVKGNSLEEEAKSVEPSYGIERPFPRTELEEDRKKNEGKEEEEKNKKQEERNNEKEDMREEKEGTMYYLTRERLIETIDKMDRAHYFDHPGRSLEEKEKLVRAIKEAYKTTDNESILRNQNFLEVHMPSDMPVLDVKEIHMAALMGTYVGYHIEKNEPEQSQEIDPENMPMTAIVKHPMLAQEMPQELLEYYREKIAKEVSDRIHDIVAGTESYENLMVLIPLEDTIEKTVEEYSDSFYQTEENKPLKAYVFSMKDDIAKEMDDSWEYMDKNFAFHQVDWNQPDTRKKMLETIDELQKEGNEMNISQMVGEIELSFSISSEEDLIELRNACEDFEEHPEINFKVKIDFNGGAERNLEIQKGVAECLAQCPNAERDIEAEMHEKVLESITEAGMGVVIGQTIDHKMAAIMGMSLVADDVMNDIARVMELDNTEMERKPFGNGGY